MELRSVAYNPNLAPGMHGMQDMQGMMGMPGGVMGGAPGMYPPGGFVNLDVDMDPGCASLDLEGPMPCSPRGVPMMEHQYEHHCPAPTPTPAHEVYVVKKGDSVYKIAKRYGTTMQAIILGNNLRNPDLIYPGQILFIPGI